MRIFWIFLDIGVAPEFVENDTYTIAELGVCGPPNFNLTAI
jgi:hypothetical protein